MESLLDVLVFGLKTLIVVAGTLALIVLTVSFTRSVRPSRRQLSVTVLNEAVEETADAIRMALMDKKTVKRYRKERRRRRQEKDAAADGEGRPTVYVVDFSGDIMASGVDVLRDLVSALLFVVTDKDEVVLRLESSGGGVSAYGLAASQLARLRQKEIPLTVCVDKIAASGGYLMACQGTRLLAAPFAVIGSIGVVAPVPNIHRLLRQKGVDYDEMTAGRFKRTVSFLGEITEEGRKKFQEQLEDTHVLFKDAIRTNREGLAIDDVSTGEYWYGTRALELQLIDEVKTSDDYLIERMDEARLVEVKLEEMTIRGRLSRAVEASVDRLLLGWVGRLQAARYGAG